MSYNHLHAGLLFSQRKRWKRLDTLSLGHNYMGALGVNICKHPPNEKLCGTGQVTKERAR